VQGSGTIKSQKAQKPHVNCNKVTILELYESVTKQTENHCIKKLCEILGLQRSSYYYCAAEHPEGKLYIENLMLKEEIIRI
jgi:hypothetical protein